MIVFTSMKNYHEKYVQIKEIIILKSLKKICKSRFYSICCHSLNDFEQKIV